MVNEKKRRKINPLAPFEKWDIAKKSF